MFYVQSERGVPMLVILSLGVMGWAVGWGNSSAAAVAVHPQSRVFGENGILRFVTHSRAMHFLVEYCRECRCAASFFHKTEKFTARPPTRPPA